jgi:hypothetical protein
MSEENRGMKRKKVKKMIKYVYMLFIVLTEPTYSDALCNYCRKKPSPLQDTHSSSSSSSSSSSARVPPPKELLPATPSAFTHSNTASTTQQQKPTLPPEPTQPLQSTERTATVLPSKVPPQEASRPPAAQLAGANDLTTLYTNYFAMYVCMYVCMSLLIAAWVSGRRRERT